jgi:hypothetical protein
MIFVKKPCVYCAQAFFHFTAIGNPAKDKVMFSRNCAEI